MIMAGPGWLSLSVGEIWLASDGHGDGDWPSSAVTRKHLMKGLYGRLIGKCLSGCPLTVDVWCCRRVVLVHVCDYTHTHALPVSNVLEDSCLLRSRGKSVRIHAARDDVLKDALWLSDSGCRERISVRTCAQWINLSLTHLIIFESFTQSCV